MSAKTYVGERLTGDSTTYPNPKYIYFPVDGRVDEYKTRFNARSCGSGPYLSAHHHVDEGVPLSTDSMGSAVYNVRIGTSIYGCGVCTTQVGWSEQFYYTIYLGTFSATYIRREAISVVDAYARYPVVKQRRIQYGYSSPSNRRPSWFRQWSADANGFKTGLQQLSAAKAHLSSFSLAFDGVEYVGLIRSPQRKQMDLAPDIHLLVEIMEACEWYLTTGILPGSWAQGLETAYIQACKALPDATVNMGANILEAASLLASLFSGDIFAEIPKSARQAWLAYRYQYKTTQLDVREIKSVISRLDQLISVNDVRTYGSYVRGDVRYQVGFSIDSSQILPNDVSETLHKFGLELNALNVWDIIPYSFVVDWFIPVGQVIEYFQDMGYSVEMKPKDIWWSIVTTIGNLEVFVRLPGRKLSTLPYLDIRDPSKKTVFMRCADAIALFT